MHRQLIDKVQIHIKAGDGGAGRVSFKREKFNAKGGPDGGDGGNGGDIYFVADHNMATLLDFRSRPNYNAQSGDQGGKKKMGGIDGEDLIVHVPVGTLIYEIRGDTTPILIADMSTTERVLVAKGGRKGRGNTHFKSSVNQAPTKFTQGTKGEEKSLILEIKMVADIGLVGMPNAGKSTLINYLTNAHAKVGSYPFTTITPNLGVLTLKNRQSVVVADIPGLIEGASEGKGLGDDFLRHVERTRILVHLVDPLMLDVSDVSSEESASDQDDGFGPLLLAKNALEHYKTIRKELKDYGANLEEKSEIVVINKVDITEVKSALAAIIDAFQKEGISVFGMSAATGEGIDKLLEEITKTLEIAPKRVVFSADETPVKLYTIDNLPNRRIVRLVRP